MQVWRRTQVPACVNRKNTRGKHGQGKGEFKKGGDSVRSSGEKGTPNAGQGFDKHRCKLRDEITDPPRWAAMCPRALAALKTQKVRHHHPHLRLFSNPNQSHKRRYQPTRSKIWNVWSHLQHAVRNQQAHATQILRKHDRCQWTGKAQGFDYQRFLDYHAKRDTLMIIVKRQLYDRTAVKEGAIGGSVPIEEKGRIEINGVTAYPCVLDPLATYSLFSVSLAEKEEWHYEQAGGQATLYHSEQRRRIPLSKFWWSLRVVVCLIRGGVGC